MLATYFYNIFSIDACAAAFGCVRLHSGSAADPATAVRVGGSFDGFSGLETSKAINIGSQKEIPWT